MDGMILFGIISTLLGVMRTMPQLVRLLRARHAYGVSIDTAATSMIVSSGWAIYGFVQQDISVLVNNTFQVTTSAIIVAHSLAHMARQAEQSETVFKVIRDKQ